VGDGLESENRLVDGSEERAGFENGAHPTVTLSTCRCDVAGVAGYSKSKK